ncbi:Protein RKD1 [Hibiscus syriacus]|uniref:Protein RKD1 n=1 Tax=Hibiscus syriacus TaxID=106335 RepID=A0A6A3DAE4_HIBSY|nr:Protein RKD1 [Hibiscus syriacus]
MANHCSLLKSEPIAKEEKPSPFPPLENSSWNYIDEQYHEFCMQQSFYDELPLSIDNGGENDNVFWDELGFLFEPRKYEKPVLKVEGEMMIKKESVSGDKKFCREEQGKIRAKLLSRKVITQYFYMPISQAAKELNVGLTLLKKRCRKIGIRRWPQRKLMSLRNLINNIQELQEDEGERKFREVVDVLERERKMVEEMPDMDMEYETKRLRQAVFKANYKKRSLVSTTVSQSSVCGGGDGGDGGLVSDLDLITYYRGLYDSFSSTLS